MKKGARSEVKKLGPLKVAHLNGLSVSRQPMLNEVKDEPERASNDERVGLSRAFGFVIALLSKNRGLLSNKEMQFLVLLSIKRVVLMKKYKFMFALVTCGQIRLYRYTKENVRHSSCFQL